MPREQRTEEVTIKVLPVRGNPYIITMELPVDDLNITNWIEDNLKESNVVEWDFYDK